MEFNLEEYFCAMPGSDKEKNVVIFARRHWITFLGNIVVSLVLIVIPLVIILGVNKAVPGIIHGKVVNFLAVFGGAYYLVIFTSIFNAWISYYYDLYILTTDSIVDITQEGFFNRKISQLSLLRVQDVSSKIDGILPTLFAYGDVLVETAGEKVENFMLPGVPNPQAFSAKVLELHDQLIEREGRHKQILEGEGVLAYAGNAQEAKVPESGSSYEKNAPVINNNFTHELNTPSETKTYCPPDTDTGEIEKKDLDQGGEVKL